MRAAACLLFQRSFWLSILVGIALVTLNLILVSRNFLLQQQQQQQHQYDRQQPPPTPPILLPLELSLPRKQKNATDLPSSSSSFGNESHHHTTMTTTPEDPPSPPPLQWTIILTVNAGFYDLFQNWFFYYQLLLDLPKHQVIIIAEDNVTKARLDQDASLRAFNNNKSNNINIQIERSQLQLNSTQSFTRNDLSYQIMVSTRAALLLDKMMMMTKQQQQHPPPPNKVAAAAAAEYHYHQHPYIVYTDVDTVWRGNPFPYFHDIATTTTTTTNKQNQTNTFDLFFQRDGPHKVCTGFFAMVNNAATRQLMTDWDTILRQHPQANQMVLNRLLFPKQENQNNVNNNNNKALSLSTTTTKTEAAVPLTPRFHILDYRLFGNWRHYVNRRTNQERQRFIMVHSNVATGANNKIQALQEYGLWFNASNVIQQEQQQE